jgi:hypothetical protein
MIRDRLLFEISIAVLEITGELALIVTDFAEKARLMI